MFGQCAETKQNSTLVSGEVNDTDPMSVGRTYKAASERSGLMSWKRVKWTSVRIWATFDRLWRLDAWVWASLRQRGPVGCSEFGCSGKWSSCSALWLMCIAPDPFLSVFSFHQHEIMSETAKDKGAVSTKEKGGAEKRGRGRPRKTPQVWGRTSIT